MKKYCIKLAILLPLWSFSADKTEISMQQMTNYTLYGLLLIVVLLLLFLIVKLTEIYFIIENNERTKNGMALTSFSEVLINKYWVGEYNVKHGEELLPHSFDGIGEYNNSMPPWLRYLFLSTIVFAVSYMSYYYVFDMGKFQDEEYVTEIALAKEEVDAYVAKMANSIDETNVKLDITNKVALENGKTIFAQNCIACHGAEGQGGIGPNLTDNYWKHGGSIASVFKTIKYGITEKGMISWKQKLKPVDIQDVSNYILSLKGTNPANPKGPEGVIEN